jgi:hypothetical protein
MAEKKWVERGGGDFFKWDVEGKALEGLWRGTKPGKFGDLGILETGAGNVSFPLHTALALMVEGLKDGTEVRIEYHGKQKNENTGREFKAFKLFTAEQDGGGDMPTDDDVPEFLR